MIICISGPPKSGKTVIANALRNDAIAQKRGALLVDETQDGAPMHLLEKIIDGEAFGDDKKQIAPGTPADKVKWKTTPLVILVAGKETLLAEFEKLAPGFQKQHGPVVKLTTSALG